MIFFRTSLVTLLALCVSELALAQEPLQAILDRGYIAHWLVCGPFSPDADGGVMAAVKRGDPALADRDYMASAGGIGRLMPKHLLRIKSDAGEAIWQQAGTQDATLDLSPFFPKSDEGVAYAAFITTADAARAVFLDLETPLGARVWCNGKQARDIEAKPVVAAGLDRFVLNFSKGTNVVVAEIPGAAYAALAKAAGMSETELAARGFVNRPLLRGRSGYEIALEIAPADPLGDLYYVPRLRVSDTFASPAGAPRLEASVRVFNPTETPSTPVSVTISGPDLSENVSAETRVIAPGSAGDAVVSLPVNPSLSQAPLALTVRLSCGDDLAAEFRTLVQSSAAPSPGRVYLATGAWCDAPLGPDWAAQSEAWNEGIAKNAATLDAEPAYGFNLGPAERWLAALTEHPELREPLRQAIGLGRCATQPVYAGVDARIVSSETLARDFAYGTEAANAILGDYGQAYYSWDMPGLAAQTPALLADFGLTGIVSDLERTGLSPLFRELAPDGTTVLHRRKTAANGPSSVAETRRMADVQRRELTALGFDSDLLVDVARGAASAPFFVTGASALAKALPSILVRAAGPREFFERLRDDTTPLPLLARRLDGGTPGMLLAEPQLFRARNEAEMHTLAAERCATLAALFGAYYPDQALDTAWRRVLHWSAPGRIAAPASSSRISDALADLRYAYDLSGAALRDALTYIAREADTLRTAPDSVADAQAVLVYNPAGTARTAACEAGVIFAKPEGLAMFNGTGDPIPFEVIGQTALDKGRYEAKVRFIAEEVPALGYRTYYAAPKGLVTKTSTASDPQIENDFFTVGISRDTGAITLFEFKNTRRNCATGPLNEALLLAEDSAKTKDGAELWTEGGAAAPGAPSEIRLETNDIRQSLIVRAPLGEGTLTRTITLYRGVPRLECAVRYEGALDGKLLAVAFQPGAAGRVPVFGAPFGASVGAAGQGALDYRTENRWNRSGHGAQPALGWAALAPGDYIRIASGGIVPLAPAAVVYGDDPLLRDAAEEVVKAFAKRGIPAYMRAAVLPKQEEIWTDSTVTDDYDDGLDNGSSMRILIGGPRQNKESLAVLQTLPLDQARAFEKLLPQAAPLLMNDARNSKRPPVHTLIFAGDLPVQCAKLANAFASEIGPYGIYNLLGSAYAAETPPDAPEDGFAVLFPGARLCALEPDGRLLMFLAHGAETPPAREPIEFTYSLLPFDGAWRDAPLAAEAETAAFPLVAAATDLHAGRQPGRFALLDAGALAAPVAAFKPSGFAAAAMTGTPAHPRDGIALRVWDSTGKGSKGAIRFGIPLRDAQAIGLDEHAKRATATPVEALDAALDPFQIRTMRLLFSSAFKQGPASALGPSAPFVESAYTRYWRHNTGAPAINGQPVVVLLRGDLEKSPTDIHLVLANPSSRKSIEGTVTLTGSDGLSIGPAQFFYSLEPGKSLEKTAAVTSAGVLNETAGIAAETSLDGSVYRDVLCKQDTPVTFEATRDGVAVTVNIANKSGISLQGHLELITTPGHWTNGLSAMVPVSAAPYETRTLRLALDDATRWAAVKLSANGHALYANVEK